MDWCDRYKHVQTKNGHLVNTIVTREQRCFDQALSGEVGNRIKERYPQVRRRGARNTGGSTKCVNNEYLQPLTTFDRKSGLLKDIGSTRGMRLHRL